VEEVTDRKIEYTPGTLDNSVSKVTLILLPYGGDNFLDIFNL